ncbi:ATP synthase F0 subunit B [Mariprofundus ferrooxydans]|nr:ATP synthase F0 subunit B [Mariprofundus ferrooxydans]
MPQFETMFFSAEVFWTIVSFAVLFVALAYWILPRVASILQQRAALIEEDISTAHKQLQEADALKNKYVNRLANVEQEIKIMFSVSDNRIIERRQQLMDEWNQEMGRKKQTLIADIEAMRQQAVRDVRCQSADLIVLATEQLIHQKVSGDEAQKVLDEAIAELENVNFKQD